MSKKLNIIEAIKMPIGTEFNIEIGKAPVITFKKIAIMLFGQTKAFYNLETDKPLSLFEEYLNATFIPIQQPVSFMEAIANKANKIKVDINGLIDIDKNAEEKLNEYRTIGATFYCLGNRFTNEDIVKIIQEAKWYIEESEELEDERPGES